MKRQNHGLDPIAVLYDRAICDLLHIQDLSRIDGLRIPGSLDQQGPEVDRWWVLLDNLNETYRRAFRRFDESVQLDREIRQQPQVAEVIAQARAKRGRQSTIEEAKTYLDKGRELFLVLMDGLSPVQGERTMKTLTAKIDDCREIWSKHGFSFEETQAIPLLIEDLRTELACISVDHRLVPKKARWTQLEKDVRKLNETRMRTKEILNALKPQYPNMTWEMVRAICNKKSKRVKRGK